MRLSGVINTYIYSKIKRNELNTMGKRMVTRTIKVNFVTSMITNIKTATVENHLSVITGEYDNATIEKTIKKELNTEETGLLFACITKIETDEKIYGMPEDEFLIYATEITR